MVYYIIACIEKKTPSINSKPINQYSNYSIQRWENRKKTLARIKHKYIITPITL